MRLECKFSFLFTMFALNSKSYIVYGRGEGQRGLNRYSRYIDVYIKAHLLQFHSGAEIGSHQPRRVEAEAVTNERDDNGGSESMVDEERGQRQPVVGVMIMM